MSTSFRFPNAERCVNCGWNMLRTITKTSFSGFFDVRVGDLPAAERELLMSWLPKIEDVDHLPVCKDCEDILCRLASEPRPVERRLGHRNLCAPCGVSVERKRFHWMKPKQEEFFRQFIPKQLIGEKKLCQSCNSAAAAAAARNSRKDHHTSNTVLLKEKETDPDISLVAETETEDITAKKELRNRIVTNSSELPSNKVKVTSLPLDGYSNVRGKKDGECVACAEAAVRRLNLPTRQQLLLRHKIYVSTSARVCEQHRVASNWPTKQDVSQNMFTGEEIADVVFLLKGIWPIDFGNVENFHRHILKSWTGLTMGEFEQVYQQNPILTGRADGKFALAVWLASKHTGECDTVLASVSQRPRGLVTAALKLVNESTQPQ